MNFKNYWIMRNYERDTCKEYVSDIIMKIYCRSKMRDEYVIPDIMIICDRNQIKKDKYAQLGNVE